MSQHGGPNSNGKKAAEALARYRLVNLVAGTPSQVEYPDAQADDDVCYGITEHACAADEHVTIRNGGPFKLTIAEAIAQGALIAPGPSGKGQVPDVGNFACCRALEAGTTDGDVIEVEWITPTVVA